MISVCANLALASKSRLDSLVNSFHLVDSQSVFQRPIDLIYLQNFISLESGLTTGTSVQNNAEALVSYKQDEKHHFMASLGHQDQSLIYSRKLINSVSGLNFGIAQNPIHLFYAIDDSVTSYAFGLLYSKKSDKQQALSESSAGLSFGSEIGQFQINTVYIPVNIDQQAAGKSFDGGGYMKMAFSYLSEETLFEFKYTISNAKLSTDSGGVITQNEIHTADELTLGLVDANLNNEDMFFWGAQVVSTRINCKLNVSVYCGKSFSRTVFPVWFGTEINANDWLIFRGAIKQSFFINLSKDEFGYSNTIVEGATGAVSDFGGGPNDTLMTAGAGLKFKQIVIDGTLAAASNQNLNTNNLLSQVSVTLTF